MECIKAVAYLILHPVMILNCLGLLSPRAVKKLYIIYCIYDKL